MKKKYKGNSKKNEERTRDKKKRATQKCKTCQQNPI